MAQKNMQIQKRKSKQKKGGLSFQSNFIISPLLGGEIYATQDLFYRLFRKNTDIKGAISKLQLATGKNGYFFEKNNERIETPELKNAFRFFRNHKSNIIRDLWISGNAFVLPLKNGFGKLVDFQVLDPRSITICTDEYGNTLKYIQQVNGNIEIYKTDELYHLVENNDPDNSSTGLSRVETLIYDVLGDNEAMISNYAFFKNNAIPNTIVILDDEIDEEDYSRAIKELKSQFSGGANAGKVSTNTGIKDIKTIGQSNRDMQYIDLRRFTTDKVCTAMGVPKTVLGYHDGVNYSTGDNHYRTFIEETVRPLEDLIAIFITWILRIEMNDDDIGFLFVDDRDFDRTTRIDEYDKMLNMGIITINEIWAEMGYEKFECESADKPIIKKGYEFIEDIGTGELLESNQIPNNE